MKADRDRLTKFAFPQLRKLCESRGVTWNEVDLRRGITDEQVARGEVLPRCLDEIHRCRPYFIGLLAERYGSSPRSVPQDLIDREPWLKSHQDRGVTELEILHGVFRDEKMHGHAYFYFRDPGYLERIPEGSDRSKFASESPQWRVKLEDLKQRIRGAAAEEVCKLRENYRDPRELNEWIIEDFTRLIDRLYPEDQPPDPLDRQAAEHEAFAQSRLQVYIGGQENFDRLDAHAAGDGPPLVLLGESGSGKSALLANWVSRYRAGHPGDLVLQHFIGGTAYSAMDVDDSANHGGIEASIWDHGGHPPQDR